MNTLLKLLIAAIFLAVSVQAAAFEKTAVSRSASVEISSDKPLSLGNNMLIFYLKDKKFADAKLKVKAFMPAMPGMPYMEYQGDAKSLGNGKYETQINFAMHGTWQLHIFLEPKSGKKVRIKTSLNL